MGVFEHLFTIDNSKDISTITGFSDLFLVFSLAKPTILSSFQHFAPVAQMDRALASGAKGQAFESPRVYHLWHIFWPILDNCP